ncbi:MAG: nucleosidase [Alloprevotella sp.]|nr:nucleosidase [Alloprevotella sp.]
MKKLLLAFALPEEVVPVELPGWESVTCITGISKPYAAARLSRAIAEHHPDAVLNIGSAGTLCHSVGDIFVCRRFVDRDIARQKFDSISPEVRSEATVPFPELPTITCGQHAQGIFTCNTGEDFVTAADHVDGDVIDMEAFAEALVCREFGIPFVAVKYVTDVVGQNSMQIWEERLSGARTALRDYFRRYLGEKS